MSASCLLRRLSAHSSRSISALPLVLGLALAIAGCIPSSDENGDTDDEQETPDAQAMVQPDPDQITEDEHGHEVALELFLVRFADDLTDNSQIEDVAADFNAEILGSSRSLNIVQFQISSDNLEQTRAIANSLEDHELIQWATPERTIPPPEWNKHEQIKAADEQTEGDEQIEEEWAREVGQLESNAVVESEHDNRTTAEIYTDAWNDSPTSKPEINIGIVEPTPLIDDSVPDLSNLRDHIELHAEGGADLSDPDSNHHASLVTGAMIARTGNAESHDEEGTTAGGLLDYLGREDIEAGDFHVYLNGQHAYPSRGDLVLDALTLGVFLDQLDELIEDQNTSVVNMSIGALHPDAEDVSFGLPCGDLPCDNESPLAFAAYTNYFRDIFQEHDDVVFVVAAPNDAIRVTEDNAAPSGLGQTHDNVIVVGGHNLYTYPVGPYPRADEPGTGFGEVVDISASYEIRTLQHEKDSRTTHVGEGNSYAAPLVAATAAAMKSIAPDLSAQDIITIMRRTAFGGSSDFDGTEEQLTRPLTEDEITEFNQNFADVGDSAVLNVAGALDAVNDFIEADNEDQRWRLTDGEHDYNADHSAICQEEFGDGYDVAEWNDLSQQNLDEFFDAVGATDEGNIGFMTRGGDQYYTSNRAYYAARHGGDAPSHFLVHDDIDSNRASLGSWDSSRQIVCEAPQE